MMPPREETRRCTVTGPDGGGGLSPRDPDGSCSTTQPSLHEVDMIASSGTLSF
jgi:hypothetical protein